jgi:lysophospholipase L1-like esterase
MGGLDVTRQIRMMVVLLAMFVAAGYSQTAPAPAPAPVDPAQQMATMQKKLDDWPQLSRYRAANAQLGAPMAGEKRVVFFGDSITDAWGTRPGTGTFFLGKPYVNRGISGQTSAQLVVRFRPDVVDLKPAAVVILIGTNDVAGNTGPMTPKMSLDNIASMVDMAKANGIKVIVGSIPPSSDFPWKRGLEPAEKIEALNVQIEAYCKEKGVTYIDYYSALVDDKGGMKEGTSVDGVHPNAAGYAIMSPLAQAAIDKTLGTK